MSATWPSGLLYLWDRRTFYLGTLAEPLQLSHAAAMLTVSLDEPLRVHIKGTSTVLTCHSVLFAAGQNVCASTGNATVATCYLDPYGQDYAALASTMKEEHAGVWVLLRDEQVFQQAFRNLLRDLPSPDATYEVLDRLLCPQSIALDPVDPRIVQVVELIKTSVADNLSVETLAEQVNLSVPRLVQLFKQYVGVPIRRYRQWHRLYVTAVGVARGHSLTQAAIAAGFTDSAHFSNTFRTMLGMKPSTVLSNLGHIRLFAPAYPELDASLSVKRSSLPLASDD